MSSKSRKVSPKLKASLYDRIKSTLIRMKDQSPNITSVQFLDTDVTIVLGSDGRSVDVMNKYYFLEGPLLKNYHFNSIDEAINFDFEHDHV